MVVDTDKINIGDIVIYELHGGKYKDYFYVHNIIDKKFIASGISQDGCIFDKDDGYYFHRKATRKEKLEFERLMKLFNIKFDVNNGVKYVD